MRNQFTCYKLKNKNGYYYLLNKETRRRKSLKTKNHAEAMKLTQAYNDAANQPIFNLALARVYLAGTDPKMMSRTWQDVMNHIVERRGGETQRRWRVATLDKNFDSIRHMPIVETRPEHFLEVLADGKPSTNVYLRRIHNHALGMEWLLKSVLPKLLWPRPAFQRKRAITEQEHLAIIARETNPERRDFYELLWHTGASQSDAAHLLAEDINWQARTIGYTRRKLRHIDHTIVKPALIRFGDAIAELLRRRPQTGPLFPYLCTVRPGDRATEFKQRCDGVNIKGVTLHSYRYAWAERALKCGYPMRFAQEALGHNSKAVHHAYSKNAEVIIPSLADWEKEWQAMNQTPAPPYVPMPHSHVPMMAHLAQANAAVPANLPALRC
jgi:integrase